MKYFIAIILLTTSIINIGLTKCYSSEMKKIYLENNYLGEKNYLYVKHNKIILDKIDDQYGVKLYSTFFALKKDYFCYEVKKDCGVNKYSSYKNINSNMLYKIDDLDNHKCVGEDNEVRSRHFIEVDNDTYNSIPCCGQYADKDLSQEYFQQYE